jgi:4-amino-4-deoxy-L-arabinose transferase-like glycosyltransferase
LSPPPSPLRRLPLATLVVAVLAAGFLYRLDGYALLDPDEGRNAEVAREMARTGDYVIPHLNGVPYVDKPVLFFAATAALMDALGPTAFAARLAPLLFTLLTLLAVAWFARRLWGRGHAWTAVLATAGTPFVLAYSRTVIFDSALSLWVVLSLLGFHGAVEDDTAADPGRRSRSGDWHRALAWGAMGLGVLTKGPIAIALPLMIAVPYAVWRRAGKRLVDPVAVLLFLAIVIPWAFAMTRAVPDFIEYALVTETAARLATPELGRTGPFWYFLAILPAAALPWTVVALAGWRTVARHADGAVDRRMVFLAIWILIPLLFFTLSQSKRPQYVLPLIPAFGLAAAGIWRHSRGIFAGVRPAAATLGVLGALLLAVRSTIPAWVAHAGPDVAGSIPRTAVALGTVCVVAAVLAWAGARHRWIALGALCLPVAAIPAASTGLMRAIGAERSARDLADVIAVAAGPHTEVVGVGAFPPSLPFYLRRTIVLSTTDGSEVTSNYVSRNFERLLTTPGTTLRDGSWWREALATCSRSRIFVARTDDEAVRGTLARDLPLLAVTRRYAAYGPCGGDLLASRPHRVAGLADGS